VRLKPVKQVGAGVPKFAGECGMVSFAVGTLAMPSEVPGNFAARSQ
jgi:hypothetical protein